MFFGEGYDEEVPLQNSRGCPVGRRRLEAPEDTSLCEESGMGICPGQGTVQEVVLY